MRERHREREQRDCVCISFYSSVALRLSLFKSTENAGYIGKFPREEAEVEVEGIRIYITQKEMEEKAHTTRKRSGYDLHATCRYAAN